SKTFQEDILPPPVIFFRLDFYKELKDSENHQYQQNESIPHSRKKDFRLCIDDHLRFHIKRLDIIVPYRVKILLLVQIFQIRRCLIHKGIIQIHTEECRWSLCKILRMPDCVHPPLRSEERRVGNEYMSCRGS